MNLSVDHKPKEYYTKKWYVRMTIKLPSEDDDKAKTSVHDNVNKAFLWYATKYPDLMDRYGGTQNVFRLLLAGTYKGSERKTNIGDVVKLENLDQDGVIHASRPRRMEPLVLKNPTFDEFDGSDLPTPEEIEMLEEKNYNEWYDLIIESILPCLLRHDIDEIEFSTIRQLKFRAAKQMGLLQSQKPKIPLRETLDSRLKILAQEAKNKYTKPLQPPVPTPEDNLHKMKVEFKLKNHVL